MMQENKNKIDPGFWVGLVLIALLLLLTSKCK